MGYMFVLQWHDEMSFARLAAEYGHFGIAGRAIRRAWRMAPEHREEIWCEAEPLLFGGQDHV